MPLHWIQPDGHCSCGRGIPGHVDHEGRPDYRADHDIRQGGKHPLHASWQKSGNYGIANWTVLPGSGPSPNVGIRTGTASGFWALDWDPAAPGVDDESWALERRMLVEVGPPSVGTGGGGSHWYLTLPDGVRVGGSSGRLPPGWDVRGEGGQVVAPPSVSGKGEYRPGPLGMQVYGSPPWLPELLRPAAPPRGSGNGGPPAGWPPPPSPAANPASAGPGNSDRGSGYAAAGMGELLAELRHTFSGRNNLAYRVACRVVEFVNAGWVDPTAAYDAWAAATQAHPDPAVVVPDVEVASIWRSAQRHVADGAASLPQVEALPPLPPTLPPGPPPFPGPPHLSGGPTLNGRHGPSPDLPEVVAVDPGRSGSGAPPVASRDAGYPQPAGTASPESDPWELAVRRAMSGMLAREEAKRRVADFERYAGLAGADGIDAEWLDLDAVLALPVLEPLVEGVLYLDTLARLNGPSGHGKTFVSLDLALRVTRGLAWAGRAVRAALVDYIVAEGVRGIGARVRAWEIHNGPVDRSRIRMLPRPVQMLGPEWVALVESCRRRAPGLVVIDTQARATEGIDEVDRAEMSRLVAAAETLRRATGACVLLVHHTPQKGDDGRGHTEVKGALQSELLARKNGATITVASRKQKDHEDFAPIDFELTKVYTAASSETVQGVVVAVQPVEVGAVPVWRDGPAVVDTAGEPIGKVRARQLWQVIHDRYNPGMGGTQAEIRAAWADVAWAGKPTTGAAGAGFRKSWARTWADLIQRGLIAKAFGASRFKVVVLADQSGDGVLTSNRDGDGQIISEGPTGFEVILTDVAESDGGV